MRPRSAIAVALTALAGAGAGVGPGIAQQVGGLSLGAPVAPATPLVTLDQDRLFADSLYGRRVAQEIEVASQALAQENRALAADLEAEELRLTEERATLQPDEFRAQADAFDERVIQTRREQDTKARDLQRRTDQAQQTFLAEVVPILAEIVAERGAVAILDERAVFLAADSIDITEEALRRVDAVLGAGPTGGGVSDGGNGLSVPAPELRMPQNPAQPAPGADGLQDPDAPARP